MPFSTDDLERLRRDLAQLPQNRPRNVSNRDAVAALTGELAAAQRLGYTVQELAQVLSDKGLKMTAGTLKGYLQRTRKKKRPAQRMSATANGVVASPRSESGGGERGAARPPGEQTAAAAPARPPTNGASAKPPDTAIGKGAGGDATAADTRRPVG